MSNARANLLLHPVRLRIVTAAAGRELTAADLAAALPDVPQATLYRHLKRLVDGGMLAVVAENPVRGPGAAHRPAAGQPPRRWPPPPPARRCHAARRRNIIMRYFWTKFTSLIATAA